MIFGCGRVIPALPFLEVFFLGRRDTWDWLFALVIQVYAVAAKHDERARETCILSAQPGSDLRVRIHAHHIHVASQLLALRTRDVAGLIHVLDHAQLDAVAFALDLLGLFLRFGADAIFGRASTRIRCVGSPTAGRSSARCCTCRRPSPHTVGRSHVRSHPPAPHAYARTAHRR